MTSESRVRVRYAETDQMGVTYHANYLVWFEVGRGDFFRAIDLTYRAMEAKGVVAPVVEARCRYLSPALYDDEVIVRTTLSKLKAASCRFSYRLTRAADGTLLAEGETTHAFTGPNGRPVALRKLMPQEWELMAAAAEPEAD